MVLAALRKLAVRLIGQRSSAGDGTMTPSVGVRSAASVGSRCIWAVATSVMAVTAIAQTVNYTYDEAGRLKSVTNTINETAEYVYDAAGNLTQIRRTAANVPAVTDFRPDSGPIGTVVTISGANFSATPASNTVRFNGTLAAVSSASTTQLVTTVPAGATTGPVSVQTSAGTGTSFQNFTVTASGAVGAPTITGFNPAIGLPNTLVTISGTNFATAPGQTKVFFNQSLAPIQSITTTSIVALVPAATGSGRIRVVTALGTATSTADFVIPPPTTGFFDLGNYGGQLTRLTVGGSGSISLSAAAGTNRWGLYLFEGGPNTFVSMDFTGFSTTPSGKTVTWEVRSVRNEFMTGNYFEAFEYVDPAKASLRTNRRTVNVPPMPLDGTYALFVSINGYNLTQADLTAQLRADPELQIDGASADFSTSFVGQTLRYVFRGAQSATLGQAIQGLVPTPSNSGVGPYVRGPDWQIVTIPSGAASYTCGQAVPATKACGAELGPLRSNGTYSLLLYPQYDYGAIAVTGKFWLSNDLTGTLTPNQNFDTPVFRVGQNGRFTFAGTQGQYLGVTISNVTFAPTDVGVAGYVRLFRSDGTELQNLQPSGLINSGATQVSGISFPMLPGTDTYTLFVDPQSAAGGSARIRLWQAVAGTLAIDGTPLPITLPQGQNGRIIFTVPAGGRNLGLGISGLTYTPNSVDATNVTVRRISDGATVGSLTTTCGTGNPGGRCDVNLRNLAAGDYAIQITPPSGSTSTPPTSVSMTLTLSTDVAPLPKLVAGAATLIGVTHTGQNARLTFDGLVGDRRGLAISGLTSEDNQWLGVTILKPDNTTVLVSAFATVAAGVSVIDIPILDAGGVYTVYLDPAYASIASASVTLSNDAVGTLPIDGTPQNVTLNGLGQYATYDFTVSTPGQNLGLGLSALALTPASGGVNLVLDQIGGVQTGCYLGPPVNGCALNLANLAAGSYRILAKPPAPTTAASFTLTLSTEVTGPKLTLGTPYSLAVNRYGQNARLSFGGVVGENRRVTVTSLQGLPAGQYVRIGVRRPSDGYQFMYNGVTGPGGSFDISNLAQTGDYTLWFAGDYGQTYSLTVNVTQY